MQQCSGSDMLHGRSICSCDQFCLTTKQNTIFFGSSSSARLLMWLGFSIYCAAARRNIALLELSSRPLALFSIVHPSPPYQAFTSVSSAQQCRWWGGHPRIRTARRRPCSLHCLVCLVDIHKVNHIIPLDICSALTV